MTSFDAAATPATPTVNDDRPIGTLVNDAVDDLRTILTHEQALVKAELAAAARFGGIGIGLVAAALPLLTLSSIFLVIAVAEGFAASGLSRWAAYLLTAGIMIVVSLLLVGVGVILLRRVRPPRRAIETTRATIAATLAQLKTLGRPNRS